MPPCNTRALGVVFVCMRLYSACAGISYRMHKAETDWDNGRAAGVRVYASRRLRYSYRFQSLDYAGGATTHSPVLWGTVCGSEYRVTLVGPFHKHFGCKLEHICPVYSSPLPSPAGPCPQPSQTMSKDNVTANSCEDPAQQSS